MPAKIKFKETVLSQSMSPLISAPTGSRLCMSIFLMMLAQHGMAQTPETETPVAVSQAEMIDELSKQAVQQGVANSEEEAAEKIEQALQPENEIDSLEMLQQQEQQGAQLDVFKPIEFEDLEELPVQPIDQAMADEIYRVAEQAKQEAQSYRQTQQTETVVADISQQELVEINQAPVNVDQL